MHAPPTPGQTAFPPSPFASHPQKPLPIPGIDWRLATPIPVTQICPCSQTILSHQGYMTGYLETHRGCTLRIERLWQTYNARELQRSILLLDEHRRCHVVAHLHIFLKAYSPALKRQLIESSLPFGHVLHRAGIEPLFKDRSYFTLPQVLPGAGITPHRQCCRQYFGRRHEMANAEGEQLAIVYEVLP